MIRIGTSHFVCRVSAENYYRRAMGLDYFEVVGVVKDKLAAGEIHLGAPPLQLGQRLELVDDGTRYAIVED
jgi:hypothetical protein